MIAADFGSKGASCLTLSRPCPSFTASITAFWEFDGEDGPERARVVLSICAAVSGDLFHLTLAGRVRVTVSVIF